MGQKNWLALLACLAVVFLYAIHARDNSLVARPGLSTNPLCPEGFTYNGSSCLGGGHHVPVQVSGLKIDDLGFVPPFKPPQYSGPSLSSEDEDRPSYNPQRRSLQTQWANYEDEIPDAPPGDTNHDTLDDAKVTILSSAYIGADLESNGDEKSEDTQQQGTCPPGLTFDGQTCRYRSSDNFFPTAFDTPTLCPPGFSFDGELCRINPDQKPSYTVASESPTCPTGATFDGTACRSQTEVSKRAVASKLAELNSPMCPPGTTFEAENELCAQSSMAHICPSGSIFNGRYCLFFAH